MKKNPTAILKKCRKCGEEKCLDLFYEKPDSKDGKDSMCKACKSEYYKTLNANPERKARRASVFKQWYKNNQQHQKLKAAERYIQNKEEIKNKIKTRWNALTEEEKAVYRHKSRQREKNNPNYKAIKACRRRLAKYVKNKQYNSVELIGCSPLELRSYLESLWTKGMSWENYGFYGWHIDHKRPISSFDFSCAEQIRQCFHYSNLQPLWAKDNLAKGSKII